MIIGLLYAALCGVVITRMIATGTPFTLVSIFPLVAAGIVIFVPLYKKYIRNDKQPKSN